MAYRSWLSVTYGCTSQLSHHWYRATRDVQPIRHGYETDPWRTNLYATARVSTHPIDSIASYLSSMFYILHFDPSYSEIVQSSPQSIASIASCRQRHPPAGLPSAALRSTCRSTDARPAARQCPTLAQQFSFSRLSPAVLPCSRRRTAALAAGRPPALAAAARRPPALATGRTPTLTSPADLPWSRRPASRARVAAGRPPLAPPQSSVLAL
jgi:hypothetical protein